jgi:hypothetical protein
MSRAATEPAECRAKPRRGAKRPRDTAERIQFNLESGFDTLHGDIGGEIISFTRRLPPVGGGSPEEAHHARRMRRPLGIDVVFEVKVSFSGAFFGRASRRRARRRGGRPQARRLAADHEPDHDLRDPLACGAQPATALPHEEAVRAQGLDPAHAAWCGDRLLRCRPAATFGSSRARRPRLAFPRRKS